MQADGSWGPAWGRMTPNISIGLEVGFSQSIRNFGIVAEDYLFKYSVEEVVIIDIKKNEPSTTNQSINPPNPDCLIARKILSSFTRIV